MYVVHNIIAGVLCVLLTIPVWGQSVGSCSPGTANAELDIGNVRARVVNDGGLFWNGSPSVYEVPIGSGINAIFASELNVVAKVNDEIRVATSVWGGLAEYWPGPIDPFNSSPSDCSEFDHIWSVERAKDLTPGFQNTPGINLLNWPVNLGAPFVDLNGDSAYDPSQGDYPKFFGDQMHWWVMNDVGNVHRYANTLPLGIEVKVSAFAFDQTSEFRDVTFFRYEITNRQPLTLSEVFVGKFVDMDVGEASDDLSATDSSLSMIYLYNNSNFDATFGEAPPAVGMSIVEASHSRGFLPSDKGQGSGKMMTHSTSPFGFDPGSARDPVISVAHYNLMTGKLSTGEELTEGGYGTTDSGIPTTFAFPGDPVTGAFWSEMNLGSGHNTWTGDRRMFGSYGPFNLEPNESATFTFAYLWARGADYLDSVLSLRQLARRIHDEIDIILTPRVPIPTTAEERLDAPSLKVTSVYPNPASSTFSIEFTLPRSGQVELSLYDLLSRKMATVEAGIRSQGKNQILMSVGSLSPGLYRLVLKHASGYRSSSIVVL